MTSSIKIENLSKKYIIGHQRQDQYLTFRDVLTHKLRAAGQRIRHPLSPNLEEVQQEDLWALQDINLVIDQGERVGIIGRNGAGKSTLLKVLSRITEPTKGRFTMNGRVASLLEVGTGFHPELSGRENIYLNGAILGMSKVEIKRKFDEIVAFSETEKFLDTPVKRYSSGMYVRLAFSVAAHLESEILIVDEVLAVGDSAFQAKCLGKMKEIGSKERTVLFVSHNMGAIRALCENSIWFDNGRLMGQGNVDEVVNKYLKSTESTEGPIMQYASKEHLDSQITKISVVNTNGRLATHHPYDELFEIQIEIQVKRKTSNVYLGLHIHDNELRTLIFSRHFIPNESTSLPLEIGAHTFSVQCPANLLVPGGYCVSVHLATASPSILLDGADHVCYFELSDSGSEAARRGFPWRGSIAVPLKWETIT